MNNIIKQKIRRACSQYCITSLLLASGTLYGADLEELASRGLLVPTEGLHAVSENEDASAFEMALDAGWSSKHMSEGVDVFGEGGIWVLCPRMTYKDFSFYIWHGGSDSINASETDFVLSYAWNIGDRFTVTPAFEWARYSPGSVWAYTPAVTLNYQVNDWLDVGAYVESDAGDNRWRSYYDVYVQGSWELSKRITLNASILYGFNDGYLGSSVAHGSNTIDYSLSVNFQCTERISYVLSVNYSQALTVLRQATRYEQSIGSSKKWGDEFWVGTYLTYEF